MKGRLILNLELLKELDLSINEFCAIWDIYCNFTLDFDNRGVNYKKLEEKQYIKIIKDEKKRVKFLLREKAKDLIDIIVRQKARKTTKTATKTGLNVDILTRIPEYRSKWKGLKPGAMGSLQSCKDKLIRWMNESPGYTFDQILKAADLYIDSVENYRYLQRADYFIYKQENNREETSGLSAFIDEVDNNSSTGEWTTRLN